MPNNENQMWTQVHIGMHKKYIIWNKGKPSKCQMPHIIKVLH